MQLSSDCSQKYFLSDSLFEQLSLTLEQSMSNMFEFFM